MNNQNVECIYKDFAIMHKMNALAQKNAYLVMMLINKNAQIAMDFTHLLMDIAFPLIHLHKGYQKLE